MPSAEKALVKRWLSEVLLPAVAAYETDPKGFVWPMHLRFERLQAGGGICAVTWSFSGPDGPATFEFVTRGGQRYLIWRRIGHYDIYQRP